jgi:2-oxoglutarate dehydrogenase E1 component
MTDVVLGMTHRGRLNALVNVLGKSYEQIFREFEGELDPASAQGSGDVKYHLGATGTHTSPDGATVSLTLAANPSHLEAVDPVVEGMARAIGDAHADAERTMVLPVLVHGDAAFAGQGVVAETFNLSAVPGYEVGGTVHVVVNNQLGFTTAPDLGRSSVYATDIAKMVQAPIFHVNGDDPEAAVRVVGLAFEFRRAFRKDVVVDLVCYRRYGHNEADEPAFTQPRMYGLIDAHHSVRAIYTQQLLQRGEITEDDQRQVEADFRARLDSAFAETHAVDQTSAIDDGGAPNAGLAGTAAVATGDDGSDRDESADEGASVDVDVLELIVDGLTRLPESFSVNPKLERHLQARRVEFDRDEIDWALAEALAFGSLLLDGTPVRLAGQDTRRGTFSQRHSVLVDQVDEGEYEPLNHLADGQAPFMVYDTVLSEYAALGFEYGYSIQSDALVCWEAQFGDFANVAQAVIDQFVVAAADKWGQRSGLAMLLPHGFEGQGPEHSSARIERYLTLCAEDNLRVVYPSTAAQYFHALRRQVLASDKVPLVCFTPKRYLRMPQTRSPVRDFVGRGFRPVLDDRGPVERATVERVIVCTGKVAHELMDERDARSAPVAVVRVEQLYPWPDELVARTLAGYPNASNVWWVQEEPENMGAWTFVSERLRRLLGDRTHLDHLARDASASPASGSTKVHDREQRELVSTALS